MKEENQVFDTEVILENLEQALDILIEAQEGVLREVNDYKYLVHKA